MFVCMIYYTRTYECIQGIIMRVITLSVIVFDKHKMLKIQILKSVRILCQCKRHVFAQRLERTLICTHAIAFSAKRSGIINITIYTFWVESLSLSILLPGRNRKKYISRLYLFHRTVLAVREKLFFAPKESLIQMQIHRAFSHKLM